MLYAARLITARDQDGYEYTTTEVRPHTPDLDPSVWTIIEAESPLDVVYENGVIRVHTPEEKLARYKADRIERLKFAGKEAIYTHAPQHKQDNCALGIYDQAVCDLIKTWIQAVRVVVDEKETAVNGAADRVAVDAVDVSYDSIYAAAWISLAPEQQEALLAL